MTDNELSALEQVAVSEDLTLAQVFAYETFSSGWFSSHLHAWFPNYYLRKWQRRYETYNIWLQIFRNSNFPNS